MSVWTTFLSLDQSLFWEINQSWSSPSLDFWMPLIADPKVFLPFLGLCGLGLLIWGKNPGRHFLLLMALALVLGDAGINNGLKHLVHRPRPYQAMEGVRMVKRDQIRFSPPVQRVDNGRSFTSGHACNNVSLAFMASVVFGRLTRPWWLWSLWLWALLISFSRIYTGDHYPSDIVGSWAIAILYCWGIVTGVEWIKRAWLGRHRLKSPEQTGSRPD